MNGRLVDTDVVTNSRTTTWPTDQGSLNEVNIGAYNDGTLGDFFNGQISGAKIHERGLTANDIVIMYREGTTGIRARYSYKKSPRKRARYA